MFLEVSEINTFYDVFQAIFDVSLGLEKGEVVCLLGRNGAGKTTTLSSIAGLSTPKGIGFVPENRWIFSELTVKDNLELGCRKKTSKQVSTALERVYTLFPRLKDLTNRTGGTLSGGEQQMLTIARALMGDPQLLLLDEMTIGLAPIVVQLLKHQIQKLKAERLTILLTEQNALFALDVSDRSYVIDKGTIVYEGTAQSLRENQELMTKYLGV
jgi:branched-chain amino acid transport system ATP-binding protein